ncbi:MAG: 30S ribosomal protein S4 [Candidatus Micrarchaeota archaeon]|nr:30S ribosomal protein S4 [Candidatus Micrarchaeota archaeon]
MRKLHKKYSRPKKLWVVDRIREEHRLKHKYGLKNMREIWIARAFLRKVRANARKLLALPPDLRKKGEKEVLGKLERYNILPGDATIDDVLSLSVEDVLKRRLQTLVYEKGLAKTIKQARQLIVHGFIAVKGRRVTSPGMLVRKEEENEISYYRPIDLEPKREETQPAEEGQQEAPQEGGENA